MARKIQSRLAACMLQSGVALSALMAAGAVHAQEAPADGVSAEDGGEIIVTARRRDEARQDVPLVVNVVSADTIQKLNLRDGTEIQNLVPGLELRNNSNGIGGAGQIRGVQFDANTSANPTVEFYFNDAPIDAGSVLQAIYDIGQVEVLRGPQGTLRGTASPSGSITFTTRKPVLDEVGLNFTGTVNDVGLTNFNGALNIPVIKDVLGIRIAGLSERSNLNRVKSIDADRTLAKPFAETDSIRVIATLQPTDWLKLEGLYQVLDRETSSYDQYASFSLASPTAPASPLLIRPKDRLSIQETARTTDQKFETYNWRGEVRLAGQALIYQGARTTLKFHAVTDSDGANFINRLDTLQTTNTFARTTSHEVRLQNEDRVLGMFDYVLGYFTKKQFVPTNLNIQTAVLLPSFLGGGVAAIANTPIVTVGDNKETSFFGNLTFHLDDATELSGGLRQIDYEAPPRTIQIGANVLAVGPAVNDEKLIYNASIKHKLTPDLMVYASTGTSRRPGPSIVSPGVVIRSARLNSFLQLRPEDSRSYELGVKSSWFDDQLILNVTGYHQKFKNYPYKIPGAVFIQNFTFVNNVPVAGVGNEGQLGASVPVTVKGVEAELGWKVTPRFNIGLIASYADGKIKKGVIPCNDINGDGVPDVGLGTPTVAQVQAAYGANFVGACAVTQRSSNQPPFSATLTTDYNLPVSDNLDFFARGLFNLYGSSQTDPVNAFDDLGSYGLVNLFAGLRDSDGAWEINFFAKNVLNTIKATRFDPPAVTSFQELAPPTFRTTVGRTFTSTYSQIQTNAPREFGVTLKMALGSR